MRSSSPTRTRWLISIGCLLALLFLAAVASYLTTGFHWDGGFHQARYLITVSDDAGQPIQGVRLRVIGPTRDCWDEALQGGRWPVYEAGGSRLETDSRGRLVVHQPEEGLQYGGTGFDLFWMIPVGVEVPEFICEFSKTGFKTKRVPFAEVDTTADYWFHVKDKEIAPGPGGYDYPTIDFGVVLTPE